MIHKFSLHDTNIILDVNSGAVHVFDDVAFDVVSLYPTNFGEEPKEYESPSEDYIIDALKAIHDERSIREAIADINELIASDLLFTKDTFRDYIPVWSKKSAIKA